MSRRSRPPGRRSGPDTTRDRSSIEVAATDSPSVAQAADDPVEDEHPGFRAWQRLMRCRMTASRRLAPLDSGVTDQASPTGRWSA